MWIEEPKRRMISAAPYRDRVVHHAVCNVVMPLFERKMIFDLYSNREGKGTHAAIRRCQEFCRRYPYVLKCDVRKYFPSMDHAVLKGIIRRTVRCTETLALLDLIIDNSNPQEPVDKAFPGDDLAEVADRRVGLPIGNLTSQWFGGIYLTPFDHWVKETLRCPAYVRYVDDFLLFAEDKAQLAEWRERIRLALTECRLRLHDLKSRVYRTADGVTFLGQRVWPWKRRLARSNVARARRRLRWNVDCHLAGRLSREGLTQRWASWRGHAMQADTRTLVERMRNDLRERLGGTGNDRIACCGAGAGTTTPTTRGSRTGTTTTRRTRTTTMGSVVSGGSGRSQGRQAERGRSRTTAATHPEAHRFRPVFGPGGPETNKERTVTAGSEGEGRRVGGCGGPRYEGRIRCSANDYNG